MLPLNKNPLLDVPKDDPFKNDVLGRKEEVENLTAILESIKEPLVLSINGQWGSGKTIFLEMWKKSLNNKNYCTLYFNAWENDDAGDPLIALIGEIEEQTKEFDKSHVLDSIKTSAGKILSATLPTIIKIASHGLIDLKANQEIKEDITDFLSTLPGEYIKYKKERDSLRSNLIKFSQALPKTHDGQVNKIIVFIDELDRCKPTFALSLLEKVKHIFSLPNYVFVLAVDKEQLGYSIQTQYGKDMDSEGYLRRFIDFNYNLDRTTYHHFITQLFENLGFSGIIQGKYFNSHKSQFFLEMLKAYCLGFALSLREIEQLFFHLKIILPKIETEILYYLYSVPMLLVIRIKNFKLYSDFISRKTSVESLMDYIGQYNGLKEFYATKKMDYIEEKTEAYLKLLIAISDDDIEDLKSQLIERKGEDTTQGPSPYDEVLNLIGNPHRNKYLYDIKSTIEFTSRTSF